MSASRRDRSHVARRAPLATAPLLAAAVVLWSAAAQAGVRRFGLFVGANEGNAEDVSLRFAEEDAARVREGFLDVGGLRPEDAVTLLGPDAADVLRAAKDLSGRVARAAAAGDDTLLLFYYSGHAAAGTLHLSRTDLAMQAVQEVLEGSRARVVLSLVDACRSGGIARRKGGAAAPPFEVNLEGRLEGEGRVVLTSSAADEDSQESDRLGASYFTHHLVSGLRGAADLSGDGSVTLTELYRYVYHQTVRSTAGTAVPQHPSYRYDVSGRGDLVLARLDDTRRRVAWVRVVGSGPWLVIEDDGAAVVAELVTGEPGGRVAVRPGRYRVQRRERAALLETSVSLGDGEERAVRPEDMDRIAYARLVRKGGPEASAAAHGAFAGGGWQSGLAGVAGGMPLALVGYGLDLRWLSVRLGLLVGQGTGTTPTLRYDLRQLGLALQVLHAVDVGRATLAAGLSASLLRLDQRFGGGEADRGATGFGFGGVALVGVAVASGVSLQASGEVGTETFPLSDRVLAPAQDGSLQSVLALRALLGVHVAF